MHIRPADAEQIEDRVSEAKPQQSLESSIPDEFNITAAHQVLDIMNDDDKYLYRDDVQTLVNWAKTKVDDPTDPFAIKWAIRDLQLKIGTPPFGDPVKNLARFAYLDMEEKSIQEEKRMFK